MKKKLFTPIKKECFSSIKFQVLQNEHITESKGQVFLTQYKLTVCGFCVFLKLSWQGSCSSALNNTSYRYIRKM